MTAADRPGGASIRRRVLKSGAERFDVRTIHPWFHVGTFRTRDEAEEMRLLWNGSLRMDDRIRRERATTDTLISKQRGIE